MDWQALGAIGEIVGAAGVIITLAYLAVQVRQNSRLLERNTEATRVTADAGMVGNFNEWRDTIIQNPEVGDLFLRGMEDPNGLTPGERLRFNYLLATYGWTAWQLWRVQGLLGTPNVHYLRHLLLHRGGRAWYEDQRPFFPPDFRASLDEELRYLRESGTPFFGPSDCSSMFAGRLGPAASEASDQPGSGGAAL